MKNKLNEIFDEAKPQELDQFSNELTAPALPDEVLASVNGKVFAKTNLKKENKNTKSVWLRVGAVAACLALILGAMIVVPMLRDDSPDIEPYFPDDSAWKPTINPSVNEIILSADKVAGVFDVAEDVRGTNQYTKIYTYDPKYLNLIPLASAEYLPIYSPNNTRPQKNDLQNFINEYLDPATAFFGVNSKNYEIKKEKTWDEKTFYEAEIREGDTEKRIYFFAKSNLLYFTYSNFYERRLEINGSKASILASDTDEQIKEKLKYTLSFVCASFGKDYSNVKICRYYSQKQLKTIRIYLYSPEETVFPLNFSEAPMTSDYILLTFYTDWGSGTFCDWGGSKDEAFLSEVSVYKASKKWNEYYDVNTKAKMLTLEEAERLLEKGYVFGGHSCPLCMAAQPEVDFSDYNYVAIEYVYNESGELCIPFYAFYKYLSETEQGIKTYAKTYVAAIEVSGYEEYFEGQKGKHQNSW